MYARVFTTVAALSALKLAAAQTYTNCNPTTNTSCPSDPALGTTITVDFTQGANDFFTLAEGTTLTYDSSLGAVFTIDTEGQAPTISSTDYIFFGNVEIVVQAAAGTGIVTSFVMQSDDLDEIDWEWLGGDTTQVETNYFGKGNTTAYDRATYPSVATPQTEFHTYTIDWTAERLIWYVDGTSVRQLNYADALDGKNYPQTPMMIKLGTWDGGAADEAAGTVEWAGGYTDFSDAPFIAYVKSIKITDYSTGATSYTYGDESGSYESIEVSTDGTTTSATKATASSTSTKSATKSATTGSTTATTTSSANSTSVTVESSATVVSNNGTATTTGTTATTVEVKTTTTSKETTASTTSAAATTSKASTSDSRSIKTHSLGLLEGVVCVAGIALGYFVM